MFVLLCQVRLAGIVLIEVEMALATQNKVVGLKRSLFTRCENKLLELKEQKVIPFISMSLTVHFNLNIIVMIINRD